MTSDPSAVTPSESPSLPGKTYEPKTVEGHWYDVWERAGLFQPPAEGAPYTIVIPPPNVTGSLHMGHALNMTLQDVLIRYRRMRGAASLWVPGTDHGGIATQNVVEKILMKEGTNRHDLGRDKFLERMWAWRKEAGDTILLQSRRLGAALDWTRLRFTMDEVCSRAVRHAFVELYNRKLLYRGKRLVNWCPRCHTALADIEVEHEDRDGSLWHIRYPLAETETAAGGKRKGKAPSASDAGHIIVATTRPETMLGDTGVAVNPKDKRYKNVVGAHIKLPITGRLIPIVADDAVDQAFGSGAVKVTPSHDPTDFEIAERHHLEHIAVIGFDGRMTEAAGAAYAGLDRFEARKKIVEELEATGALEKAEPYKLSVSVCYRCGTVIEPLESEQWFLSMGDMARRAGEANKSGQVQIVPKSWENPYQLWLKNLKDWCVSRQIWWGHRIPVWYCEKQDPDGTRICPPVVSETDPTSCPACGGGLTQDPDVLDTWFSSALWPMSVFHWPDQTPDLKRFYPTSTLVTGHEILYLWVARMVMFGLEFMGKVPFETVLIHGIVRDKKGRKMSKSLGNVIDPLELIEEFGADAVRFSLAHSAAPGRDMQISKENFVSARNFSNKIWNATRFLLMRIGDLQSVPPLDPSSRALDLADRWILGRFNEVIRSTTDAIERFDLDTAARGLYDFFWADFCDWYLEMVKPRLDREHYAHFNYSADSTLTAKAVLGTVLEGCLRLLHPFVPFITEELWNKVPKTAEGRSSLALSAAWPKPLAGWDDPVAAQRMRLLQEVVTKLRTIRSEMGITPEREISVLAKIGSDEVGSLLREQEPILKSLNCRVGTLTVGHDLKRPAASATAVVPGADFFVPLEGLIDFAKESSRLEKERGREADNAERLAKKMANDDFLSHAPADEVERTRARLIEAQERLRRLDENLAALHS